MSAYDEKPWLKFYDPWVKEEIEVSDGTTYVSLIDGTFAEFAAKPGVHFMGTTLTFGQIDEFSKRFANFLKDAGLKKGDVVGVNMPNIPQYLISFCGILRAGCVVTGVSPLLTHKEIAHQLNDSGAKALVTLDAIFEQRLLKVVGDLPNLTHIVPTSIGDYMPWIKKTLGKALKKYPVGKVSPVPGKTVMTFPEVMKKYPPDYTKPDLKPEDTCVIQYTGGTTGLPKGAELTHRNMSTNVYQIDNWFETERASERFISGFPLFHIAGLIFGLSGLALGNPQILIPDPRNTEHICNEFAKYEPTIMCNVPSLYQMLLENPKFKTLKFDQLKACVSGAAPFAVESIRAVEEVVGENKIVEVYGMTETSPLVCMNPHRGKKKIGSVGLPIQSTRFRLMDVETGTKEVPVGEEGEIAINGPQVMKGYLNMPDESAHALREIDGVTWLFTGDVARMDEEGYFTIVDRAKDMISVSGFKVFSREVEEKLYELPPIDMVAIVGVSDPGRLGTERVKAVVQLKKEYKDKDPESVRNEILAYCRENMAPYKVPKILEFVDELPLTPIGKVDKKALR